jgi:hypothetical protein
MLFFGLLARCRLWKRPLAHDCTDPCFELNAKVLGRLPNDMIILARVEVKVIK